MRLAPAARPRPADAPVVLPRRWSRTPPASRVGNAAPTWPPLGPAAADPDDDAMVRWHGEAPLPGWAVTTAHVGLGGGVR